MSELTTALVSAFSTIRLDVDTSDPFVTFQLDAHRINSTFRQILDAVGAMQSMMGAVVRKVDSHDADISNVRNIFDGLTKKVSEHEAEFVTVNNSVKGLQSKQGETDKLLTVHDQKLASLEQRIKAAESMQNEIKALEAQLTAVKSDVKTLQKSSSEMDAELKVQKERIKVCQDNIVDCQKKLGEESGKIKAVYDIFELSEAKMKQAIAMPPAKAGSLSPQADYCLSLPSFAGLRNTIQADLASMQKKLQDQATELKARLTEDVNLIRSKLGEKVDRAKEYEPFVFEVREELKKSSDVVFIVQKLSAEMLTKANKEDCDQRLGKLDLVKADRGDLMGFLKHNDIVPIENALNELQKAFDALCSKVTLEMRDVRMASPQSAGSVGPNTSSQPQTPTCGSDGTLQGRVSQLEATSRFLQETKADKKDLNEVYKFLEASGKFTRPATPDDGNLRRHGSLAPLSRPGSAGKERRGSIPETVRPPSPALAYTSSPVKYVPNTAKYRATATLYDSDGNKSSASVTAARAVSNVKHWNNVARHVAGENTVPCCHTTHEIPND
jgi:predicted  nucleic acid-binding Zn-ribbon protein